MARKSTLAACFALCLAGTSAVWAGAVDDAAWVTGEWGACDVACGDGTQHRAVTCSSADGAIVAERQCTAPKPATTRTCDMGACVPSTWTAGPWTECDVACGTGRRTRVVVCQGPSGAIVADGACPAPKPAPYEPCERDACPSYSWVTGVWSECSLDCGSGVQTRAVVCHEASGMIVSEVLCTEPRPTDTQACERAACPTYSWETGAWDDCDTPCGRGTRARAVWCRSSAGEIVADVACADPAPAHEEPCEGVAGSDCP